MRYLFLFSALVFASAPLGACGEQRAEDPTSPRDVIFRSHLDGALADDPVVGPGEEIRVLPAPNERTLRRMPVRVTLPETVPFGGPDQLYFLRGYAVGRLTAVNQQFL